MCCIRVERDAQPATLLMNGVTAEQAASAVMIRLMSAQLSINMIQDMCGLLTQRHTAWT